MVIWVNIFQPEVYFVQKVILDILVNCNANLGKEY